MPVIEMTQECIHHSNAHSVPITEIHMACLPKKCIQCAHHSNAHGMPITVRHAVGSSRSTYTSLFRFVYVSRIMNFARALTADFCANPIWIYLFFF